MHCGTEFNTYQTLDSMTFVTPSGTVLNTADTGADGMLREHEPELHAGLLGLRRRVRDNAESVRTVRRLFSMKNTMGYGLNAFLDFEEPIHILEHLLIGSEGTLGFVAEAVFRTVEVMPEVATGLLILPDLMSATSIVPSLVDAQSATVELLDATSLLMAQRSGQTPAQMGAIHVREHAALLVEYQGRDADELRDRTAEAERLFAGLDLATPAALTTVPQERAALWKVRKGLYATVAGNRPSGSNALLEDVVVPIAVLGETCRELTKLFDKHAYEDSVIFGHAKDGNVHFMLNENFEDPTSLHRYEQFTEDMVHLILERGGSLKAEHGTGRIMAPYVQRQYGDELYEVMCQLKSLVDPRNAFNPGVVLSDDPRSYLDHLKTAPTVEEEVDRCVECGYCEPVCPSKDLTLTPRQRIVGRREIASAEARGDTELARQLRQEYDYEGLQTCAVDGMCATACPVNINTGDLVRRLRDENHSIIADRVWGAAASAWGATTRIAGAGLSLANAFPPALPRAVTSLGRAVLGSDQVPQYQDLLPVGGRRRPRHKDEAATAVFFPACVGTMFGTPDGTGLSVSEAFLALCQRSGVAITIPDGIESACCGTPWKSKGLPSGYRTMASRTLQMLWEATDQGQLPVVCDASSCTEGLGAMRDLATASGEYGRLRFVDAVEFVAENVLPNLTVTKPLDSLVVHPTCSSIHLGITGSLEKVSQALATKVVLPREWGCCAYAGDRGMLHPELTASATAREASEINSGQYEAYASLNRTCEQGMTEATGQPFWHVLQHLEIATRPEIQADLGILRST